MDSIISAKLCLLLDRINGKEVSDFAGKYKRYNADIEKALLFFDSSSIQQRRDDDDISIQQQRQLQQQLQQQNEVPLAFESSIRLGGYTDESVLRPGVGQSAKFWSQLNEIARRNTDFIMDTDVIKKTFDGLRSKPLDLNGVENAVIALVQTIGFKSIEDMLGYITSPPPEIKIPSDAEVMTEVKRQRLPDLFKFLPAPKEITDFVEQYQAGDDDESADSTVTKRFEALVADIKRTHRPSIQPMTDTPIPSISWKKFSKKLAPPYDPTALKQRFAQVEADINAAGQIKEEPERKAREAELGKALEAITGEMNALARHAVSYWENTVAMAVRMKTVDLAYRQDVDFLVGGQRAEASRVIDEILDYIGYIRGTLARMPVAIAEGFRSEGEAQLMIAKSVNECFRSITCRQSFDFFDVLVKLLTLPKNPTSVVQFLTSIEFPEEHAAKIASLTKREQISCVTASLLYFLA
jgi:hypothetical protein